MTWDRLAAYLRVSRDPVRTQALADAYVSIVRGFLLPGCVYYLFVTWGHLQDETGARLLLLGTLSFATALAFFLIRSVVLVRPGISIARVEIAGLVANLLIYGNVVAYQLIHFSEPKLIYFILMAVVFAMSGVTYRATTFCVGLALATLLAFAAEMSATMLEQYLYIGVASCFASLGMAHLLRKALATQVDARLRADRLAAEARDLAGTDTLTGLPNRRSIFQKLECLVAERRPFWLGLVDLDGFKGVNDAYGHVFGDDLLRAVATQATRTLGPGEFFGRVGGDEFALIITKPMSAAEVEAYGCRLIDALSDAYAIEQVPIAIGASAGFACFPGSSHSSTDLYEKADFALYRAKEGSRGRTLVFSTHHAEAMFGGIAIERALRESDLEDELSVAFQPQFSLRQNRIVGFEALARWKSHRLGELPPDVFIAAAERSGHIRRITEILFRRSLLELRRWPEPLFLSFNLSAQDLSDRVFILGLLDQITELGIAPERVEFEITETAVMVDRETSAAALEEMWKAGCRVALDDFGSGYSSFGYINRLKLDKIKIDKSFVREVHTNPVSREIVAMILTLCRNLGLTTVLEGIETESEMTALGALGPDVVQGFLFGRPMAAAAALALVSGETAGPAVVPRGDFHAVRIADESGASAADRGRETSRAQASFAA
ncbi:MAG: EAL domain-containing protein [Bauldia sp.]|nr:EAL domain-containing protein [Bauldia sp.]MCW5718107.1 EAL domain-containing protein [Bauldia sp.]